MTHAERAVSRFDEANRALQDFLHDKDIREILLEYQQLVQHYNESLEDATKAVKAHLQTSDLDKVTVGQFGAQRKLSRWYEGDILASLLPQEIELEVLTAKVVYTVDEARLEQLARQGEIEQDIITKAYREKVQYSMMPGAPKAYVIPAVGEGQ